MYGLFHCLKYKKLPNIYLLHVSLSIHKDLRKTNIQASLKEALLHAVFSVFPNIKVQLAYNELIMDLKNVLYI